jgi:hypothetical protein
MFTRKSALAGLALGLAVAGLASPSFAQRTEDRNDAARDAAVHECSVKAQRWSNTMWQTTQFAVYETCMAEHGQRP